MRRVHSDLRRPAWCSNATLTAVAMVAICSPAARASDSDPWLARDKALHLGISGALAATSYAGCRWTGMSESASDAVSLGSTLMIGLGKEGADALGSGTPSWRDLTADVVGALLGWGLARLVDHWVDTADAPPRLQQAIP